MNIRGTINILLIEDNQQWCDLFSILLSSIHSSFSELIINLKIVNSYNEILESITSDLDLILLDLYLGDKCSLDMLIEIKKINSPAYICVVTVEDQKKINYDSIISSINKGVDDFICKQDMGVELVTKLIAKVLKYKENISNKKKWLDDNIKGISFEK